MHTTVITILLIKTLAKTNKKTIFATDLDHSTVIEMSRRAILLVLAIIIIAFVKLLYITSSPSQLKVFTVIMSLYQVATSNS